MKLLAITLAALLAGCTATPPELDRLVLIRHKVQAAFEYQPDIGDRWVIPDPTGAMPARIYGDCDEFALWVKELAAREGIPVRIWHGYVSRNRGHLVAEWNGWAIDQAGIYPLYGAGFRPVSVAVEPGGVE